MGWLKDRIVRSKDPDAPPIVDVDPGVAWRERKEIRMGHMYRQLNTSLAEAGYPRTSEALNKETAELYAELRRLHDEITWND